MDGTILVADDDRTIRTVLTQALTRAGCRVHATSSLVTLKRWVEEGRGDLVISDVVMPDGNGLEMLPEISAMRPGMPVIVISAQNTIMTAIQAAEADAFDYLPKPFDLPHLMKRAARALEQKRHLPPPPERQTDPTDDLPLVGHTQAMQTLYRLVARVMNTETPVLITGESGTGKSLIARAIHDFSDRQSRPFVVVTPDDLASPDGPAQILARVGQGTLLFDEVVDLDDQTQARVTRMLDRLPDPAPRVLATAQTSLAKNLETGTFRQDLYYRLGSITIPVPPLRERLDDIPTLVEHFLSRAERDGLPLRHLSEAGMKLMRAYGWPGNVRQLENAVQRLVITSAVEEISQLDVETLLQSAGGPPQPAMSGNDKLAGSVTRHLQRYFDLHGGALPPPGLYGRILREIEPPLIEIALDATGGNQARCAELLGINRNTLRKKITDLGIEVTRRRKLM